jgi:hypothetical protein
VTGKSVNNGQGECQTGAGGPARDWQPAIVRLEPPHWRRLP